AARACRPAGSVHSSGAGNSPRARRAAVSVRRAASGAGGSGVAFGDLELSGRLDLGLFRADAFLAARLAPGAVARVGALVPALAVGRAHEGLVAVGSPDALKLVHELAHLRVARADAPLPLRTIRRLPALGVATAERAHQRRLAIGVQHARLGE